jgi:3'-phosphoadenosine 5'-phosphosulfate sulfotransferase (PAPS reductase)/FAD synthetase
MKPRIAISFSGGRSSARMAELVYDRYGVTHEIKSCFVNTGKEREETLEFVHACDENIFDGELVWIESVTHGAGKGQTAKVVTYETAARNGEPFEAAIQKYGVFGPTHPQCNSRLKTEPMLWWRKSEGWEPCTYDTAIGIRADEVDRCSSKAKQNRLIYPLVEAGITKGDVNKWCAQFDWDLKLKSDADGNCGECWKKSLRRQLTRRRNRRR